MGSLIEQAIEMGISALVKQDIEKAEQAIKFDVEVDEQEKTIKALSMKLFASTSGTKDLRLISASLKMITDMERIGDHAADISEMTILMADSDYEKKKKKKKKAPSIMEVIKGWQKRQPDMVIKSVMLLSTKISNWHTGSSTVMMWWTIFLTVWKELIQKNQ